MQGLGGHTGRSPGLHLPGSRPPGTGARLQRPPAPGGGQGPRSRLLRKSQGKPRWKQHQESTPRLARQARPGQARGCHLRGPSPGLGMANLLSAPSRALYWADMFALLVQQVCLQNSGGHSLWAGAPGWPWASWSLNTGTGLNPTSSRLPDDKWIERSSNSNSNKNSYLLLPCSRCLTSIISFNLHRNPML